MLENLIILDVPLLFESGLNKLCNKTIGVIADENLKVQRICKRDRIDENALLAVSAAEVFG